MGFFIGIFYCFLLPPEFIKIAINNAVKMRKLYILTISIFLFISMQSFSQEAILIVSLDIQPKDAVVFIDQKKVNTEEGRVELTEGKHQIRILKNGFDEKLDEIKVKRNRTYFKYILNENPNRFYPEDEIKQETKPAKLKIETLEDATVFLNDSIIRANEIIEIAPQKATIQVFGKNTDTLQQDIELISEEFMQIQMYPNAIVMAKDINIDLVLVKSGDFIMGMPASKSNARQHRVELDAFYISKYEITQEIWEKVMKDNPSNIVGDSLPVENVSWNEVQTFISRLNDISGKHYRLPTEAEWEYAARGGHKIGESQRYAGGDDIDLLGWYWKNSGDEVLEGRWNNELIKQNNCRIQKTAQLAPNSLGIYDMTGNVWEWCSDWYKDDYYLESPLSNPPGPETGKTKVCRGGSYLSKKSYCRNGFRFSYPPQSKYNYLGFRLVLDKE